MKAISGKEFARLLEEQGWRLLRIKGSHHIFGKSGMRARISVPIHGNHPLRRGLLLYLARMAELDPQALE
jgi:predicted RNA binding protein YcfA (HicA-like mRNA interferase family)